MQGRIEGSCANCRYFANDGECSKYDVDVYRSDWCLDHHMDWDKQRKIERPGLVKTIENCRLIKRAVRAGVGTPNIRNGKCEGYCTERDDEPLIDCKQCKYLEGRESD